MGAWIYDFLVLLFLLLALRMLEGYSNLEKDDKPYYLEKEREDRSYCSSRPVEQCCPGRNDACTVPFFDTICYCDIFCNRTLADCCPDFLQVCFGLKPEELRTNVTPPSFKNNCYHEGRLYNISDEITSNCNNCTCVYAVIKEEYNWKCTQRTCLIRPDILNFINSNVTKHGWSASNYSAFWGLTLSEGIKRRLGTRRPTAHITDMAELKISRTESLPVDFDARREWPGLISPVLDQGNCASSWAFSTAGVASDRLHIHSNGIYNSTLSTQHLVSCNNHHSQHACEAGHIDRAWWFIRKIGVVSDECLKYSSGMSGKSESCPLPKSHSSLKRSVCPRPQASSKVYQATPPYRISSNEEEIMREIVENGPLQVVMEVKEDFYMYRSGVYHHALPADYVPPSHRQISFHSVRLIGWGADNSTGHSVKYWLCANSWGKDWGENGCFRILRGTDESRIESYVVGAWIKVNNRTLVQPRNHHSSSSSSHSKHHRLQKHENAT